MSENNSKAKPDLSRPHRSGETESFPTGQLTYLSPLPLPTGGPATDHARVIGAMNERFMDFGGGKSAVFSWQVALGFPMFWFFLCAGIFPLLLFGLDLWHRDDLELASETAIKTFHFFWPIGIVGGAGITGLFLFIRFRNYHELKHFVPSRFNRQRREVCFQPSNRDEPVFVPWESVVAWVVQAQGGSQYGVMRQYGLGLGFHDPESGARYDTEFQVWGQPLALANWEALRAYMEYEVHDLREIQDPLELQGPDDPDHEGVHFFYNARERMRRRRREGEVGWIYTFFWYLYHIFTLWTLPNRIVEWEERLFERLKNKNLPRAMERWSQPLPKDQWAQPSERLKRLSQRVQTLHRQDPGRPITDIYTQVYEEEDQRATGTR